MNKNKHLVLENRITIQTELDKGTSFKGIASILGKDCSTISKEIRNHLHYEKSGAMGRAFNDCLLNVKRECSLKSVCSKCYSSTNRFCWSCGKCTDSYVLYARYTCPKLSKPPYVCNACPNRSRCTLEKAFYKASIAQKEYDTLKSESRSSFAISENELAHLDSLVSPLLRNGQSLHHIALNHPDETMLSERTPLYLCQQRSLLRTQHRHAKNCPHASPQREKERDKGG